MRSAADQQSQRVGGFTLVELLIASTVSLMAMAAVATLFGTYGRAVSQSQKIIDLSTRIRSTAWRLRQDLQGLTAPPIPWVRPEANAGYLEIAEGPYSESLPAGSLGDTDDRLLGTTQSLDAPFTGNIEGIAGVQVFESPFAEIAWFCEPSGETFEGRALYNLYRRQLLVSATPGTAKFASGVSAAIDRNLSDISCRNAGTAQTANSLGELSKPASRFWTVTGPTKTLQGDRLGEDLMLTNVLAFDLRTYTTASATYTDAPFNTNYQENISPPGGPSLRGLEVRIRCIDPTSRQVRQVTVVHSFEPM
jgi:type II secretory pathway pseudopilin PulG